LALGYIHNILVVRQLFLKERKKEKKKRTYRIGFGGDKDAWFLTIMNQKIGVRFQNWPRLIIYVTMDKNGHYGQKCLVPNH
jgi:hypothetical protein